MRVAAPNTDEVHYSSKLRIELMEQYPAISQMLNVLQLVAKRAGFDLPPEAGDKIVEDSCGNLRKAILVLEALKMQS